MEDPHSLTLNTDVCGPFKQKTLGHKQLFVTFTFASHRYIHFKLIESRDEVPAHRYHFIPWIERSNDQKVRSIGSANACAFMGIKQDVQKKGVLLTTFTAYSPWSSTLFEKSIAF